MIHLFIGSGCCSLNANSGQLISNEEFMLQGIRELENRQASSITANPIINQKTKPIL